MATRRAVLAFVMAAGLAGTPVAAQSDAPNPFNLPPGAGRLPAAPEWRMERRGERMEWRGMRMERYGRRMERHGLRLRREGFEHRGRMWERRGAQLAHRGDRLEHAGRFGYRYRHGRHGPHAPRPWRAPDGGR